MEPDLKLVLAFVAGAVSALVVAFVVLALVSGERDDGGLTTEDTDCPLGGPLTGSTGCTEGNFSRGEVSTDGLLPAGRAAEARSGGDK